MGAVVKSLSPTLLCLQGLGPARPAKFLCPWDFPVKNPGVGCFSFSRGSSPPRDWTGRFFTTEPPGKPTVTLTTENIITFSLWQVQFSSVAQSCPTLSNPMNCSTPGFPVLHQFLELVQTQVQWSIQLSHPLSYPSLPAFNLSQHQGLFQWVSSSHQVAKVLELQL